MKLAISVLFLAACSDYGLETWVDHPTDPTDGAARIQVLPEVFDFGVLGVGCATGDVAYTIRNVGDAPLNVDEVVLTDGTSEVILHIPEVPAVLDPDQVIAGTVHYEPLAVGATPGTVIVRSDDPLSPEILRPLHGEGCDDLDGDGICDIDDADSDGDGIPNAEDRFPTLRVVDEVHVNFDGFAPGTRVNDQLAGIGVHFVGSGQPGQGWDTNVVRRAQECTMAVVESSPNVLCTYVNDGFNFAGDPAFAGWVDEPADAVVIRMYNAGHAFAATHGNERDQATLYTYDANGNELGTHTAVADTSQGDEYVDLTVLGRGATSFELYTGDFDAVDDLYLLRLEAPECP